MTKEDRAKALEEIADQRWKEFEGGQKKYVIGTPEAINADSPAVAREFYDYYRTSRGHHPRSTTAMSRTSDAALMNFFPFAQIETISPRPILFIAGENANSRYFSEDAYKQAAPNRRNSTLFRARGMWICTTGSNLSRLTSLQRFSPSI